MTTQSVSTPTTSPRDVVLAAPLGGWLTSLDEVDDPVFAGRILGDGFAVDPTDGVLCAPFAGTVTSVHRACHAVTLRADGGAEVLMHIGLDTVALKGEGFEVHVAEGTRVAVGDPLVSFDVDMLAQLAKSLMVPVVVTNPEEFTLSALIADREVRSGEAVLLVRPIGGDGLAELEPAATVEGAVVRRTATLADPFGLHARPAGVLAAIVKDSGDRVTLLLGEHTANAGSPVALMLLGASCGQSLTVEAIGPTAAATADRIVALLTGTIAPEVPAAAVKPAVEASAPTEAPAPEKLLDPGEAIDFEGVAAAPGLATGVSVRVVEESLTVEEKGHGVESEAAALQYALQQTAVVIEASIAQSAAHSAQQADILRAHLAFVRDPDLEQAAGALIRDGKSAAFAWKTTIDRQVAALRKLGNPVLVERAADLEDIRRRVLLVLLGRAQHRLELSPGSILFADDLLPSQFADLDLAHLAGICLAGGGPTAHVAILAASKGIPAVVAAGAIVSRVPDGQSVVLDAENGRVRINPPSSEFAAIRETADRRRTRAAANRAAARDECRTADGTRIEVVANLGGPADVAVAVENGAEGCGLLRSEFLFLDRTAAPSEDEQFAQYQAVATGLAGRPLIIRTLDAGADKDVPYVGLPEEENPALGLRGVRTSLWRPELLHAQVCAILRVEPIGQARILLPMVATIQDLRDVRAVIAEEEKALGRTTPIEVGIMIEVPSAALIAERLAAEVDFFSVGTNDLTQYTLAMDRVNARLARQLDAFHPAVLKLIATACDGAAVHGRWVGVCGSLASFPNAAPLLVGLGVRELSVTAGAIAEVKAVVRTLDRTQCEAVAREAMRLDSGAAVRRLVAEHWPEI
ncbi:MAG: phosphoenolpyruvate--protein phosphotransferase [Phyllobacteriaceae bacterium]|nr:phosphoenolpyruvate--protein phosphotransferase [Phyllobacteriaceae bacterium]